VSLVKSIEEVFKLKKLNNWDKLYFAVDLHNTIIKSGRNIPLYVYPEAERGLKFLSTIPYITLILFTSTHRELLQPFYCWCYDKFITFKYLNENPECSTNKHQGDYSKKFYYSVLLDDRAGFDYRTDWDLLIETIERIK
jgi:hypothetical protein